MDEFDFFRLLELMLTLLYKYISYMRTKPKLFELTELNFFKHFPKLLLGRMKSYLSVA